MKELLMLISENWSIIVAFAAACAAAGAGIWKLITAVFKLGTTKNKVDLRQKEIDKTLEKFGKVLDETTESINEIKSTVNSLVPRIKKIEETIDKNEADEIKFRKRSMKMDDLLLQGVMASLNGLREQGCNGPVTEAAETIKTYERKMATGVLYYEIED